MRIKDLFLSLGVLLLTACSGGSTSNPDSPKQNPYVSGFTTGMIPKNGTIQLLLTADVTDDKLKDKPVADIMKIEPKVKGRFELADPKTIVFRPEENFQRNTKYVITADLKPWFGAKGDDASFQFSVNTMPLALSGDVESFREVEDDKYEIVFRVNSLDVEEPQTVQKYLIVSPKADFTVASDKDGHTHRLTVTASAQSDPVTVKLSTPDDESVGLKAADLCTNSLPRKGVMEVFSVYPDEDNGNCITIVFTKQLDPNQKMVGLATIDGNVSQAVDVDGNKLKLYPDKNKTGDITVKLSSAIRSKSGLKLGTDQTFEVALRGALPRVEFTKGGTIIPQGGKEMVSFKAIYAKGVTVRLFKIYPDNVGQLLQDASIGNSGQLAYIGYPVAVKTLMLDRDGADLTKSRVFALNLHDLVKTEPGAIYRIELSIRPQLSAWPQADFGTMTDKEIEDADQAEFESLVERFSDGYYWSDGSWQWTTNEWDSAPTESYYYHKKACRNVLATNIGLTAFAGRDGKVGFFASDLNTAAPLSGVDITVRTLQGGVVAVATTNSEGIASVSYDTKKFHPYYAVAEKGSDVTYLRMRNGEALSTSMMDVSGQHVEKGIKGYIYGERGVWRPGDTLHISFMLDDRMHTLPAGHPVSLKVTDATEKVVYQSVRNDGQMGLYSFDVPTSPSQPTGTWSAHIKVGGVSFDKNLRVETIKPNRLKIDLDVPQLIYTNGSKTVSLHTEWLTGAEAHNLKYDVEGVMVPTKTTWKGLEKYSFDDRTQTVSSTSIPLTSGTTDAEGNAAMTIGAQFSDRMPGMLLMNMTTRVFEPSGEFSIDATRVKYSPFTRYVGIWNSQSESSEGIETDKANRYEIISVDEDGRPRPGTSLTVKVYKRGWYWWWSAQDDNLASYAASDYDQPRNTYSLTTDQNGKAYFSLNIPRNDWGIYLITALDSKSGHQSSVLDYYDWPEMFGRRGSDNRDAASMLTLTTGKDTYKVGETMTISFPSVPGGKALVNICNGTKVLKTSVIDCSSAMTTTTLEATDEMRPNVYACISMIQPYQNTTNDMPIRMYGVKPVMVENADSHLTPVITADDEIRPMEKTYVTVSEQNGRTMAYTLAVVDEGLLDLTHFKTPDAWTAFNGKEALGVNFWDMYADVSGAYGGRIEQMFSIGGDEALNGGPKAVVNRFTPMVHFEGPFTINKGGKRKHEIDVPNYTGRVRVMVVATDGNAYGNAEKSVKVAKPVMLLGTMPRQVGVNDETEIAATVFVTKPNISDVKVAIETDGNSKVIDDKSKSVSFDGRTGDRTISFKLRAGEVSGKTRIKLTAQAGSEKAVYETDLVVRRVTQSVAHTEQNSIEPGKSLSKKFGSSSTKEGRVDVEVSGIKPINMARRLNELMTYPHGCAEQIVSGAMPQVFLSDMTQMTAEQLATTEANVKSVITRLNDYRTSMGGVAYWPGGVNPNLWATAYDYVFLTEAAKKGFLVPSDLKSGMASYLRKCVRGWQSRSGDGEAYGMAVFALANDGKPEQAAMNRMWENKQNLSDLHKKGLAAAFAIDGKKAQAQELISGYDDALKLITLSANGDVRAAEVAEALRARLMSDNWMSTYETAMDMLAMQKFLSKNKTAGGIEFKLTADGNTIADISSDKYIWQGVAADKVAKADIEIKNKGKGTIFATITSYSVEDQAELPQSSNGLVVNFVAKQIDANGSASPIDITDLPQGTSFTAHVVVSNNTGKRISNVAISQILPAGWEVLSSPSRTGNMYQDIRDDRVLTYYDDMPAGISYSYDVNLVATYKGKYSMPAITAEMMYDAKVNGTSASGWATVR